jgi:hypothetical protein
MDTTAQSITAAIALQIAPQIDSVSQLNSAGPVAHDQSRSTAADVSVERRGDSGVDISDKNCGAQIAVPTAAVVNVPTAAAIASGQLPAVEKVVPTTSTGAEDISAATTATVTEVSNASSGATTISTGDVPPDDLGEKCAKNFEEGSTVLPRHFASWQNVAVCKLSELHSQFVLGAHITASSAEQVGNGDGWNGYHRSIGDAASAAKTVDLGNGVKKYRIFDVIRPLNPTAQHAGSKGAQVMEFCTGEVARYSPHNGVPIDVIVVGLAVEVSSHLLFSGTFDQ